MKYLNNPSDLLHCELLMDRILIVLFLSKNYNDRRYKTTKNSHLKCFSKTFYFTGYRSQGVSPYRHKYPSITNITAWKQKDGAFYPNDNRTAFH